MFDLTDRVAMVTGAGRGLGAGIAGVLAAHGASVVVNDLDGARAEAVVADLVGAGGRALSVVADVTDPASVLSMVDTVEAELGRVDILINNAGIPPAGVGAGPFVTSDPKQWQVLLDLNLLAVMHCVQAVLPGMLRRRHGRIITMVSDAARVGEPNIAVYAAAKAGAATFSKSLAKEVGRDGVTVNCISLGSLVTERQNPESIAKTGTRYPVGRLGVAEDVVPVVLLLASDESAWITGQTYGVDGGYATS
ncbi:MAG TPA: SDR family oxidoreductase [Acidimicrobiales bacterium]|nr:SDR family oxidoreductase [Acidimicrobiales bacterium]